MRQVDLVVMGAGPAGAAAARAGVARGLSVALIDKAAFPRDKLCGGLLTGRTATQLRQIFGLEVQGAIFQRRDVLGFSWKGKPLAEIVSEVPFHLTMRRDFDLALVQAARAAGAEVHEGAREADPGLERGAVRLASGEEIGWKVLIGADGVNSDVARCLFGAAFDRSRIGFALEAEVPLATARRSATAPIQIDLGGIPWGYAWSFPKAGSVTVGLVAIEARLADFKARMARLVQDQAVDPGLVKVKGHFIPFGDFRAVPGRGRVLLAGDAAGLVDPMTGEGIAYALESGAKAAHAAADWLQAGQAGDLAGAYADSLGQVHRSIAASGKLARIMHARLVPAALKQRLVADPRVQRKLAAILAGTAESSDVADFNVKRFFAVSP